jgi:hypothetical protein
MTAPKEPETESFIQWGVQEAKAAELRVRNIHLTYHTAGVIFAVALFFGGLEAWKWHTARLARLEVEASALTTAAKNEAAVGDAWRKRAIALGDSITHDTVRVRQIITHTKTVMVPVAPPPAQDGVTYSIPLPPEPIPMVARADFDTLAAACTRVEHDCAAHGAAQDSARAHLQVQLDALNAQIATEAKARASEKRAATIGKGIWGAVGLLIGRIL